LVLLAFAALALGGRLRGVARMLPAVAVLALSLLFDHWAGVLGLGAALLVWVLATWYPALTRWFWILFLPAYLLLSPFQGLLISAAVPPEWTPRELELREQIWRFALERCLEKPVFGWGFDASDSIPNFGEVSLRSEGQLIIPNHPHNAPLQLWLELGLPGVLLGGWFLLRLKERVQAPLAQAVLMFVLLNGMLSWGLWRPRWVSIVCLGVLLC
jgi:O-antigen ligase